MGLLLGFAFLITCFVLAFQLSVLFDGLFFLCFLVSRFIAPPKKQLFLSISKGVSLIGAMVVFIVLAWSYLEYASDAALSRSPVPDTVLNRYWKDNLQGGGIGTVSFMNPILKPILSLLPRNPERRDVVSSKPIGTSTDTSK